MHTHIHMVSSRFSLSIIVTGARNTTFIHPFPRLSSWLQSNFPSPKASLSWFFLSLSNPFSLVHWSGMEEGRIYHLWRIIKWWIMAIIYYYTNEGVSIWVPKVRACVRACVCRWWVVSNWECICTGKWESRLLEKTMGRCANGKETLVNFELVGLVVDLS